MTKREDNKLRMYQAVAEFLTSKFPVISGVSEMVGSLNALKELIQSIQNKFGITQSILHGKTQDKYDVEADVIEYAMAVAGGLFAYGAKKDNNEFKETGKITRSYLERLREVELVPIINNLLEKVRTIHEDLSSYGITPEILNTLEDFVRKYYSALNKRESAAGLKVGARSSLKELMMKADDTMVVLDKFSEIIKLTNPDFYLEYNSVRNIKNIGEGRSREKQPEPLPETGSS